MRITDKLAAGQTLSFEIFPPKGEMPLEEAYRIASQIAENKPDWISVTYSAGGSGNSANTVPIAARIEGELGVTALAHLTCMGATSVDVDVYVDSLNAAGIQNVLTLRGDRRPGADVVDFAHASDLIAHLRKTAPSLCIGAACYPRGTRGVCLARRVDARPAHQAGGWGRLPGLAALFDNDDFYRFREQCLRYRIKLPVVAGIMPLRASSRFSAWRSIAVRPSPPRL